MSNPELFTPQTEGTSGGIAWRLDASGRVVHADGRSLSTDEMAVLMAGLDPHAGVPAEQIPAADIDLGLGATWLRPDREAVFGRLRDELPVSRHRGVPFLPGTEALEWWALARYDDVMYASRHPNLFVSGRGGTNIADIPGELAEFLGSIINMDSPQHTKLRRLISAGFTPRQINRLEESVRTRARAIVDRIAAAGSCEVITDIAAPLPLQVICDMMGIPAEDEQRMFELSNIILGFGDPDYVTSLADLMSAGYELYSYGLALAEDRLAHPRDDIATALVQAEVDGERLTPQELGSFFVLLVVAGNETTRTAIAHGLLALSQFPDQKQRWLADLDGVSPTAVEEIVRWATPVLHFRRTATEDVELGGTLIAAGDRVVLLYLSANRDPAHFEAPDRFDVTRHPNDHVGFGAGGPHFCLGANLARREIRVMFEELLGRLPDIEVVGEPNRLRSAFINGIKQMRAEFTPAG